MRSLEPFPRTGRSVVVIDDDPDDLVLMRRALLKAGVTGVIHAFAQPASALAYLRDSACSSASQSDGGTIVFCDLRMPGIDGFTVLQRIRAQPDGASICVIIVSGCALQADVERARELGADGYLEKMPSPETLRSYLDTPTFAATGTRPELFEGWEAALPAVTPPASRGSWQAQLEYR